MREDRYRVPPVLPAGRLAMNLIPLVAAIVIVFTAVAIVGTLGCGSDQTGGVAPGTAKGQTSSSLSPMLEAYYQAHPSLVDGPLYPVPKAEEEIEAEIRAQMDRGEEIWLPGYLPDGFVLAAPYNGQGNGAAYPNPYAFGNCYSVTYTDGQGYIIVIKNSEDDLSRGEWSLIEETAGGRRLRLQKGTEITLVATVDDGGDSLLVAGAGFAGDRLSQELVRVATGLTRR